MDLVAPGMTSKNPHFCSGCLWVNSCLPGQCGPILLSSEPLPGLLLICIAWASDLLRIWQLFLWQCYTDYNPSILIIYENKHVCMVWQCTAVTEPSGSLPLVCDQSCLQSEFKANLDYKMRFHIKKTTTKQKILFFTATSVGRLAGLWFKRWAGVSRWCEIMFLFWNRKLPGTGFSQLKKEQRGTFYDSQDLSSEPALPSPPKSHWSKQVKRIKGIFIPSPRRYG